MEQNKKQKPRSPLRTWGAVVRDIYHCCQILEVGRDQNIWQGAWDRLWDELFEISRANFTRVSKSYLLAEELFMEGWKLIFAEELLKEANCLTHWYFIAENTPKNYTVHRIAVERIYKETKGSFILSRWTRLKKLIDSWHPLMPEVEANIMRLKKQKQRKK